MVDGKYKPWPKRTLRREDILVKRISSGPDKGQFHARLMSASAPNSAKILEALADSEQGAVKALKEKDARYFSCADDILDAVREGRMKPSEAERLANKGGHKPFACEPDPAQFDPMKETLWSLPMVLGWILWRDVNDVRRLWDAYRADIREWDLDSGIGAVLRARPPAKTTSVNGIAYEKYEGQASEFRKAPAASRLAFLELQSKAMAEEIKATGIPLLSEDRRPVAIPDIDWRSLVLDDRRVSYTDHDCPVLVFRTSRKQGYWSVELLAADVIDLWPSPIGKNSRSSGPPAKRGAKGYGEPMWEHVRSRYIEKLSDAGFPSAGSSDPEWRRAEDAAQFVIDEARVWLENHSGKGGREPGRSTAQARIRLWDEEYRAGNC